MKTKRLVICAAVTLGVLLLAAFIFFDIGAVLFPRQVSSVAIIGGADGPTAIYVRSVERTGFYWEYLLLGILVILAIVGIVLRKKRKN